MTDALFVNIRRTSNYAKRYSLVAWLHDRIGLHKLKK